MSKYRTVVLYCLVVFSAIVAGCSSSKPKPDVSSTAAANPAAETKPQLASAPVGSSSLDSLRSGESTATPAYSALQDVYFDFDRYDLRADARATLKTNGEWLKANPAAQVQIEGHCDERGTTEYNIALGAKRAQAVKDYLVTLGVAADRLSTISYGEEVPVCREQTEDCWQKNRRARFVVQPARPAV